MCVFAAIKMTPKIGRKFDAQFFLSHKTLYYGRRSAFVPVLGGRPRLPREKNHVVVDSCFVDVFRVDFCVFEDPFYTSDGTVEQRIAQALELRSRDAQSEVLAFVQGVHVYTGLRRRGQFPLRAVAGEVEASPCFCVEPGRVGCALLLEELGVLLAEVLSLRWN